MRGAGDGPLVVPGDEGSPALADGDQSLLPQDVDALIADPRTDHDTGPAPDPFAKMAHASRTTETPNVSCSAG
jgi:hypothetical protein